MSQKLPGDHPVTISKTPELEDLDCISKRLKYIIDTLGVKQSHMAEKLGLSPSGLHYILNNDVKFSKNAKKIAEYLSVNENWLLNGEGDIYAENTSIKTYKISIYYPDQLKLLYLNQQKAKIASTNYYITTSTYSNHTLAIYMTESNFAPKFEIGDIIVFEQVENFKDGEILLVYLRQNNNITLKHGFHCNEDIILLSYDAPPLQLSQRNGDVIIGAYRECQKRSSI